jgi:Fe-S-cluster-containing hydrogenase component 2
MEHANLPYRVIAAKCIYCGNCARNCPLGCITLERGSAHIDAERCVRCGECVQACFAEAIVRGA